MISVSSVARKTSGLSVALLLCSALVGCEPGDGGGSGDPNVVPFLLGSTGVLAAGDEGTVSNTGQFDIREGLPVETPGSAEIILDPDDVLFGSNGPAAVSASLELRIDPFDAADVCSSGAALDAFTIGMSTSGTAVVTPESVAVNSAGFAALASGQFSLCVTLIATSGVSLTIDQMTVRFLPAPPVTAESCEEILALPLVQAALAELGSNGEGIVLPASGNLAELEGEYTLDQETTFDPDETNVGDVQDGRVTLSNQTSSAIRRSGFDVSLDFFIQGHAATIGFCTLERTANPECDQTVARIEILQRDDETGDLSGEFLAVAVRRHASLEPSCGAAGDFIFGTLTLARGAAGGGIVERRGKLALPDGFDPDLIILPPDDGNGTVTDFNSGLALHFETAAPFGVTEIRLPVDLERPAGFNALGISRDGSRLALVTDEPDAAIFYNNRTLIETRFTAPITSDYLGARIDFSPDAEQAYVPTTDPRFADRITVLRTGPSTFGDEVRRLVTPQGRVPLQARVSPDGSQLAVLLGAGAPPGFAGELVFMRASTGEFLRRINLESDAGGSVIDRQLVYSRLGERVFMAGFGAVVAVETSSPFDIRRVDVSEGALDHPVGLGLSGDGEALAVAVDDNAGTTNFAVINPVTLQVLNTQDLVGIDPRGAIGVAHFESRRVALVANFARTVVPVQTISPFAAGSPLSAADRAELGELFEIVGGGDVIAVTNVDEPGVYIFGLAGGQ